MDDVEKKPEGEEETLNAPEADVEPSDEEIEGADEEESDEDLGDEE